MWRTGWRSEGCFCSCPLPECWWGGGNTVGRNKRHKRRLVVSLTISRANNKRCVLLADWLLGLPMNIGSHLSRIKREWVMVVVLHWRENLLWILLFKEDIQRCSSHQYNWRHTHKKPVFASSNYWRELGRCPQRVCKSRTTDHAKGPVLLIHGHTDGTIPS